MNGGAVKVYKSPLNDAIDLRKSFHEVVEEAADAIVRNYKL